MVIDRDKMIKVSVKGSQEGKWGLAQSFLKHADYHGAIKSWRAKFHDHTILCFVQFKDVPPDVLPRMYLATPDEVADRLRETVQERGAIILYEDHRWGPRAIASGTIDRIPEWWKFTARRVNERVRRA